MSYFCLKLIELIKMSKRFSNADFYVLEYGWKSRFCAWLEKDHPGNKRPVLNRAITGDESIEYHQWIIRKAYEFRAMELAAKEEPELLLHKLAA